MPHNYSKEGMKNEKIKVDFHKGISIIREMLKLTAVSSRTGKSKAWFDFRVVGTTEVKEEDLERINKAIHTAGWEVSETTLSLYHPNPEESLAAGENIVEQMKTLQKTLAMDYLFRRTLGKDMKWLNNRLSQPKRYKFKDEEILTMNLALKEIGSKLMAIELIL